MAEKKKKESIGPGIEEKKNKAGKTISYKFRCCVGRGENYKQIWRTYTLPADDPRLEGLTPKKLKDELNSIKHEWDKAVKAEYEKSTSRADKAKITLAEFISSHWLSDHVIPGHTPSSVTFFKNTSSKAVEYFGEKKRLSQIDTEDVKRYLNYLSTEAKIKVNVYREIPFTVKNEGNAAILSWDAQKEALAYQVFRKTAKAKSFTRIATVDGLSFTDSESGKSSYEVKARFLEPGDESFGATSVQHYFATIKNVLKYAVRMHYIKSDPTEDLTQKEKPHRDKKRVDFMTPEQSVRFLSCLESEPLYWKALMNVFITTGLRRGEACGLQWGDLDNKKLTLSVVRNVTIDKNQDSGFYIGKTKTGESRVVPISQRVCDLLTDLKNEREVQLSPKDKDGNIITRVVLPSSGFIFCRKDDLFSPVRPDSVTRKTRQFIEKNHLPDMSVHDLRHTAASLALESGADLKQIQELLGHKDPSTTMAFYLGLSEETKRRTVEGIESLIAK